MRFIFILSLLLGAPAFATMEIVAAPGSSNFTSGTSPVIFGGYTGLVGGCTAPSGTALCNSCADGGLDYAGAGRKYCNPTSVYPALKMTIVFKSTTAITPSTAKITAKIDSTEIATVSGSNVWVSGGESSVAVKWEELCGATDAGTSCSKSWSKTLKLELDGNGDNTVDDTASVVIRFRYLDESVEDNLQTGFHSDCNADPSVTTLPRTGNQGFCGFAVLAGDEKVYIDQEFVARANTDTGGGGVLFSGMRIFYKEFAGATPVAADFKAIDPANSSYTDILLVDPASDADTFSFAPRKIEGLTNDTTYIFTMASIDQAGNISYFSDPANLAALPDLYTATPSEVAGLLADQKCFIATAAYHDNDFYKVQILRQFRDEILMQSEAGKVFVNWYYAHSPKWAKWLLENQTAREVVRMALNPVVSLAQWILEIRKGFL